LARLDLPDQVIYYADRAAVAFLTAQVHDVHYVFVNPEWCIELQREDGQAMTVQREYGGPKSLDSFGSKLRQNTTIRENSSYLLI
jgi:hypothetical protein